MSSLNARAAGDSRGSSGSKSGVCGRLITRYLSASNRWSSFLTTISFGSCSDRFELVHRYRLNSADQLAACADRSLLAINPIVYAEVSIGFARIEDLANVDSAFAIVTQDRVRRVDEGFEFVGRSLGAPPRGCSIGLDEMLSSEQPA